MASEHDQSTHDPKPDPTSARSRDDKNDGPEEVVDAAEQEAEYPGDETDEG